MQHLVAHVFHFLCPTFSRHRSDDMCTWRNRTVPCSNKLSPKLLRTVKRDTACCSYCWALTDNICAAFSTRLSLSREIDTHIRVVVKPEYGGCELGYFFTRWSVLLVWFLPPGVCLSSLLTEKHSFMMFFLLPCIMCFSYLLLAVVLPVSSCPREEYRTK